MIPSQTSSRPLRVRRSLSMRNGDPLAYVTSKNLHRRHLNERQRALVGAKISNEARRDGRKSAQKRRCANWHICNSEVIASRVKGAKLMNCGRRSVQRARVVLLPANVTAG
jgi:hypothetical protein